MGWTNVLKPTESSISTGTVGVPIGLLVAITQDATTSSVTTGWGNIAKPISSVGAWTNVTEPVASVGAWTNIVKPT